MKKVMLIAIASATLMLTSCSEQYSNGERIGMVTRFSEKGFFWKSWEGDLVVTQTGMNQSATDFEFSLDNDRKGEDWYAKVKSTLDSAAQNGWKVKIVYHETFGKNWFKNRGETSHFITACEVIDKTPMQTIFGGQHQQLNATSGKVIDTIYVVIVPKEKIIK